MTMKNSSLHKNYYECLSLYYDLKGKSYFVEIENTLI